MNADDGSARPTGRSRDQAVADEEGELSDRPIGEGETIRVPISVEGVTVEKRPVVTEEINIGERPIQETEQG